MEEKVEVFGFKGFDKGLTCLGGLRPKHYKENTTFTLKRRKVGRNLLALCNRGFHFCKNPLTVFEYYRPSTSEYAEVVAKGAIVEGGDKCCTDKIKILGKLSIFMYVEAVLAYLASKHKDRHVEVGSEDRLLIPCMTGSSVETLGVGRVAASEGGYGAVAATGGVSIAAASRPTSVALVRGQCSIAACTGNRSVAISPMDFSIASNTGESALASSGGVAAVTGYGSTAEATKPGAIAVSLNGMARGVRGSWLVLKDGTKARDVKVFFVDGKEVQENITYCLINGKLEEIKS